MWWDQRWVVVERRGLVFTPADFEGLAGKNCDNTLKENKDLDTAQWDFTVDLLRSSHVNSEQQQIPVQQTTTTAIWMMILMPVEEDMFYFQRGFPGK